MNAFAAVTSVIGVLSGTVVYLYKILSKRQELSEQRAEQRQEATHKKLDNCEHRHKETTERIISMSEDIGRLKGLEQMHDIVLKEIKGLRRSDP